MSDKLTIIQNSLQEIKPSFEQNIKDLGLRSITFTQEMNFAVQRLQENTYLQGMPLDSIIKAVLNTSLTGLSLNPILKFAYLVPRKGKCCLDPSYIGLVKILTDTGSVKNVEANVVFWGEPFKLSRGTNPTIEHGIIEDPNIKKGGLRGAYSVAVLNDGSKTIEWMDADELLAIMARSESVKSGKPGAWQSDTTEMCRKTVIKRHYKYLPKTERAILAATAIELDHENNGIDFEAEQKTKVEAPIQLDTLNPADKATAEKFYPMIEAMTNDVIPVDAYGPGTDKHQFAAEFKGHFESGTMTPQYADSVYQFVLTFFQQPAQQ